ncbi:signal peptidase I [Virgibacillus subterraneus]|uniref:Signal peptidase I n=1 Tax=Virgibacillus subterraneus TaxID=621109 RepID=A0A1H9FXP3_9BACI|nr:signal peptidase I [Virgibacillus subterraneus]SEQ42258.1 signal peptidase I [Virgibacillus subterraneus]
MKRKYLRKIIPVVLLAIALAFLFRSFLFASYVVDGESMEPTLYDGNLLMVNKVVYDLTDVDRFDVIVFHASAKDDYVKRVIGLPGDEIEYKDDKLFINGKYVKETFLKPFKKMDEIKPYTSDFTLEEKTGKTKVPDGNLFVMGDNRESSLDSRTFGFISVNQLVGKVDIKYWPFSQMQLSFGK